MSERTVRVKNWEEFKQLAVELKAESIVSVSRYTKIAAALHNAFIPILNLTQATLRGYEDAVER